MSKSEWGRKLQNIPRPIISVITILVVVIPMIFPLGIPVPVTTDVQNLYDYIIDLPEGSVIAFGFDSGNWQWVRTASAVIASLNLLFTREIKIVMWSITSGGEALFPYMISKVTIPEDKEYGVDWVYMGYVGGKEVGIQQLAADLHTPEYDYYGTPLDELSVMDDIHDYSDVDLIVQNGASGEYTRYYVRQWSVPFGIPLAVLQTPVNIIMNLPFRAGGQITWIVWANAGGAELESLLGYEGWGYANINAQNLIHIFAIIMVIIGNVGFFLEKMGRGERM